MSLIVKINVVSLGVTKTFKFEQGDRVEHVIQQVQEKTAGTQPKPHQNFGIFYKDPTNEKKSFWLLNSRQLKFYDIEPGVTLLYKDKNRYLKVKMLDKTIKTVLVDDSKSVGHALDIICQKIGIINSDEFALFIEEEKIFEDDEVTEEEKTKTNTIKRVSGAIMKGVDNIEQRRVDRIKEKAHTDDDTNWLANEKTLRESGVQDDTLVVIRRRFMFEKTRNITNPIEIALLYAQSSAAILDGSHPCDMIQAAQFAAFMIQIQHGDFDEARYRSAYIDPKEYLPKEYHKNKGVFKEVKEEHKKLIKLTDLDAKYKYIQLCQNLRTYGVTFFLVKEVANKKNKLMPCLFGVCKESVMKVDEKTKQIIKEWPLTTIKNWAASPNSFTLDFGSYKDSMYSVQTHEGAQIGALIGGYIDIILKRKKKILQKGYNDDEMGMIGEDLVAPSSRHVIEANRFKDNEVMMPKVRKVGQVSDGLSPAQKALVDNLDNSGRALLVIMDDLDEENENPYAELEPIRQARGEEFKVENVLASISVSLATISHATAVSPEELDYTALNEGISKITSNMTNLARYLKYNAKGLGGDTDGKDIIDAARNLTDTFKVFLTRMDPQKEMTYEEAYDAMYRMADASISIESVLKKRAPDAILKGLVRGAQEIERATILLSDSARQIASTLDESSLNKITSAARHVFLKSQGMVVQAKVMAPYLHRPDATEQFSTSIRMLSKDVKALASMCVVATGDDQSRQTIEDAAHAVSAELGTMLQLVQNGSVADVLMVANEGLLNSIGNPEEMKELTTLFIQAYSRIVKGIESNLETIDPEDRDKLLKANQNLKNTLKSNSLVNENPIEILEAVGDVAEANLAIEQILNKNDRTTELQEALLDTVKEIYDATKALEEDAVNVACVSDNQTAAKLRHTANRVMLRSTALVTSAKVVAPYVESPEAVKQMVHAAKILSQDIKHLTLLCNEASDDEPTKEKIDDAARTIVEGLGRMLKLFQEGIIPEKIPELVLEVNDNFLKSIGEPDDMRKQSTRFERPYSKIIERIPEKAKELDENDKNKLMDAAKALTGAMQFPLAINSSPKDTFDKIEKMADGNIVAEQVLKEHKAPPAMQRAMLQAAEAIEKSVIAFESQTKKVLDGADKETASKISRASAVALMKGRGMVVGTKVVSPYVKMGEAVDQMNDYAKAFSKDILTLRDECQNATDSQDMKSLLHGAAEGVTNALNNFLKITQNIGKSPVHKVVEKDIFEVILEAQEKLMSASGKPDDMVKQATILGQVYSQLIRTMRAKSDLLVDSDEKENLLAAAADLSDATTELLASAKRVKDNPDSKSEKDKLKSASIHLRLITNSTTDNALKKATAVKLEITAKQASAAMTRLISVAKHASPYNTNAENQREFDNCCEKLVFQEGKHLNHSVKEDEEKQGNPQALLQLINASKAFVTSSVLVINLAKNNVRSIANANEATLLGQSAHNAESIVDSLHAAIEKASGDQEEFDRAIANMQSKNNDLDQALLAAMSDNLKPKTNDSIKTLEEKISNNCNKMREEVPDTVGYSHSEPEKTGGSVIKLSNIVTPLSENVIAFAANISAEQQFETLNISKKVFNATIALVDASKLSCGLPEDMSSGIQEAADNLLQSLKDLLSFVKATSNEIDAIDYLVTNFDNVKAEVVAAEGEMPVQGKSFVDYQDQMVKLLKAITRDAHDMVAKGQLNPKELSSLCEDLYENYSSLVNETKFATILSNKEVGERLQGNVQVLGDSCKALVQAAGNFQVYPNDYFAKMDLSENAKDVSIKVAQIMSNLQQGSVGTQACINAISSLSGLLGDIDTTVMFAHAGTLDPEDEQSFGAHRETILWSSQKLVKDTKQLVEAAHSTQESLAGSVKEVLKSNTSLIDSVKIGSASLGTDDMNGQILLLNAVKDVTAALSDLINHTKTTSGNPSDKVSNENLKSSAKHMVGTLTSLLKTVRSVEDEASRGGRAIESTVDAIKQAVINFNIEDPTKRASPEDLIRATKGITVATAKAVSAANSARQADIIEAANLGRKQCIELIDTAKAATANCEIEDVRSAIIVKVKGTAQAYCGVLNQVMAVTIKGNESGREQLTAISKKVATAVSDLVKETEQLKGSDLVNPEDPNVIAENELLGAAAAIEAAARKLEELRPRERPREADESLNFEEQILEAAKSITSAAHALVKAATVAQRELVSAGKVCSPDTDVYADTQWSQGLISAARMVAEATSALCEAANAAVLGNASQEKLIASAQAVSASTAQLLLASRVKANPNSKAQLGLQRAGTAVKRASDSLVKAAQKAAVFIDEEEETRLHDSDRGLFIDELNAQEAILKQERALEKARKKLETIRVARYRKQQVEDEKDITENED